MCQRLIGIFRETLRSNRTYIILVHQFYTHNATSITISYKYNNTDVYNVSSMTLTCPWLKFVDLLYLQCV